MSPQHIRHSSSGAVVTVAPEIARARAGRDQELDAAAAGTAFEPEPCQALDQTKAATLVLQEPRYPFRAVAVRRSATTASTVWPPDMLAGLIGRFRDELEAEATMPRPQN